ncbi:MAG: dienelactone hydrolase family protein [Bdellovibrionales bacterium]
MSSLVILAALIMTAHSATKSSIQTEVVDYKVGRQAMRSYIYFDSKLAAKRPAILLVHDWMGMGEFVQKRAQELAEEGFTTMAVDIYGRDVQPKDPKEAGTTAGLYKKDRKLLRERVRAGFDRLMKHKTVVGDKSVAMGFCFGGMTALELARSGAALSGVVSFHGNLDTPTPADAKSIKGRILILHGADDPHVPPAQIADFEREMKAAKIEYQIIQYPGAVHAFTNPNAGSDPKTGAAYNAEADKNSKIAMHDFLRELFGKMH